MADECGHAGSCMFPDGCFPEPGDCEYRSKMQLHGCDKHLSVLEAVRLARGGDPPTIQRGYA